MEHRRSIVILDFGGQYAHLIARRVREAGVYSEILAAETPAKELKHAAGIILSGGPQSVYEKGSPQADKKIFDLGIPIMGLCYGHQWVAQALGGEVKSGKVKEYGKTDIVIEHPEATPFQGVPEQTTVWMSHGDEVTEIPKGFITTASSKDCQHAAMANEKRKIFGAQFHMEVVHTLHGEQMLKNFVELCDADPWSVTSYAKRIGDEVKKEVGKKNVFMLVSGGVDSTVAFTLLNKVLGTKRVVGLLVDTGLMRKGEVAMIQKALHAEGIDNLHVEDASKLFFDRLKDVYEPEAKRKIIGNTFLDVQASVAQRMKLDGPEWMLGQGTIYPDTIETGGTKHSDHIKTHHNRVEAIQKMIEQGRVIEPLKELYKDEVRILGEELGLPHELVWRHPFPGPGLGVRILCIEKNSNSQFPIPKEFPISNSQCAALPIQSVGVQGDGRTYRHAITLFSEDPFTITAEHRKLATEIPNSQRDFNRVLMCLSHKKPVEFVLSPGYITPVRAELLREADAIVDEEMRKAGLYEKIWQFPVVLLPFGTSKGGQSIVLRPVDSTEAMTANASFIPPQTLTQMTHRLSELHGIEVVFLDLTQKPPATIEWE